MRRPRSMCRPKSNVPFEYLKKWVTISSRCKSVGCFFFACIHEINENRTGRELCERNRPVDGFGARVRAVGAPAPLRAILVRVTISSRCKSVGCFSFSTCIHEINENRTGREQMPAGAFLLLAACGVPKKSRQLKTNCLHSFRLSVLLPGDPLAVQGPLPRDLRRFS